MKKGVKYFVFPDGSTDAVGYFLDGLYYELVAQSYAVGRLDRENNFYYLIDGEKDGKSGTVPDDVHLKSCENDEVSATATLTPDARLEGEVLIRNEDGARFRIQAEDGA